MARQMSRTDSVYSRMMETDVYTDLDLKILQSLQLDARVPFGRVADVVGVSDQTIARRYARLRAAGSVRVRALTDPGRLGRLEWVLRIRCTPDSAGPVGAELARRPDISWISRTSGGTELVCVTSAPGPADELLLKALPRSARILDLSAHCLLHVFFGRGGGMAARIDALTPDQVAHLRPPQPPQPPSTTPDPVTIDDIDRAILAGLRLDGRVPTARLATEIRVPPSTVQRRITRMRTSGVLLFAIDTQRNRLGVRLRTLLWLTVSPADLMGTGEALAAHPEVAFAAAVTGDRNLYASVATPGVPELTSYLTTRLPALPAVQFSESCLVLQTIKQS
jgi:DNA-binding Lrp family transcriptional regulator